MIKKIYNKLKSKIELYLFRKKWRNNNSHNYTNAKNLFLLNQVKVGKYTYGDIFVKAYKRTDITLEIGSFCSIGEDVKFLLAGEHNYKNISTYPFKRRFLNQDNESISKGNIVIEDDVWIGYNSIILSGVHIGRGAVIGAGSIVSKNIPPYAIFAGNKVIKYRFNDKVIDKLMKINFDKLDSKNIKKNINLFYTSCDETNIDNLIEKIERNS